MKDNNIPLYEKYALTIDEASEYTSIGINKMRELTKTRDCNFILRINSKTLIKRKKFEEYLDGIEVI